MTWVDWRLGLRASEMHHGPRLRQGEACGPHTVQLGIGVLWVVQSPMGGRFLCLVGANRADTRQVTAQDVVYVVHWL